MYYRAVHVHAYMSNVCAHMTMQEHIHAHTQTYTHTCTHVHILNSHLDQGGAIRVCDGWVLATQNLAYQCPLILCIKWVVPCTALVLQSSAGWVGCVSLLVA